MSMLSGVVSVRRVEFRRCKLHVLDRKGTSAALALRSTLMANALEATLPLEARNGNQNEDMII